MATIAAKAPSYLGRALVGIALTVAFYALSFVAVAVLAGLPVWRVATGHTFPTFLGIAMVVTGLTILASVVPRRQRFEVPGPELTHAGQPDVVGVVEQVAQHRQPNASRNTATTGVTGYLPQPSGRRVTPPCFR